MFELDLTALQPLRLWLVAGLLLLLFAISVKAVRRSGSFGPILALFGVPALAVIAWSAWQFADHAILQQRLAEREALNARAAQLTAMAVGPGSALACLDATAAIAEACEKALFQKAETVAGATAYVEARLRLLADGLDYARRVDRNYDRALVQLRRSLESDRYGFVAHVLASRDGCTAEACTAFALFGDASAVKANIAAQALEANVARHAAEGAPAAAETPVADAAPPPTMTSVPVTRPIDYPSAASIPPVSIMTEAPASSPTSAPAAEAPPARRPAAAATPAPRTR